MRDIPKVLRDAVDRSEVKAAVYWRGDLVSCHHCGANYDKPKYESPVWCLRCGSTLNVAPHQETLHVE